MSDETRYVRGEIRIWQTREDPNIIDIALTFPGLSSDQRTTVELNARSGGAQLRRHPNLYKKLAQALEAQGLYRGPATESLDDE